MSVAFRCDECGQFFDGSPMSSHKERVGEYEVTLSVKKAPKPLHEKVEASAEEEDDEEEKPSYGFFQLSTAFWGAGPTEAKPDLCGACLDSLLRRFAVFSTLQVPALSTGVDR